MTGVQTCALPISLAGRAELAVEDLHAQDLVMYEPGQGGRMYELLTSVFHAAGVAPRCAQYVRQTYCLLGLVAAGVGVALLPASAARLSMPGATIRPIRLPAHAVSELHLAWRREEAASEPLLGRMVALALACAAEDGGH